MIISGRSGIDIIHLLIIIRIHLKNDKVNEGVNNCEVNVGCCYYYIDNI